MIFLTDVSSNVSFARTRGARDKKKRTKPSIRKGALWGAGIYGGLNAASGVAIVKNPDMRKLYNIAPSQGKKFVLASTLGGATLGAGIGAGVNAIRKRMYENKYGK